MAGSQAPPNIEASIYDCILISQKVEEWRRILESARDNPQYSEKQLTRIQDDLGRITDIIFKVHGRSRESDELISKYYYGYMGTINEIRESFDAWAHQRTRTDARLFLQDRPYVQQLIEDNFVSDEWTIEDLADYLVNTKFKPSDIAVEFVETDTGYSEDHIKKKIKKIYSSG